ncbi:hypothetical protein ACWD7Y_05160 [Streptomyces drozdowiczii]
MLDGVILWGLVAATAVVLVVLSTYARGGQAPTAGPDGDPTGAPRDSRVFLQCDSLECGHNARPHDTTPSGLICSRCGRNPAEQ